MPEQQKFYLYCRHNNLDIRDEMGMPDYSYKFVENYFCSSLSNYGEVVEVSDVSELPPEFSDNEFLFIFAPPQEIPEAYIPNSIAVFAWEYSTIPNEPLDGNELWNWQKVLQSSRAAITHSSSTLESMELAEITVPKMALFVPLFEHFEYLSREPKNRPWSIVCDGHNWDSAARVASPNLAFSEVTYTYVFNPLDGRKRWEEAVSGFVWAHRSNRDVALILKLIHKDQKKVLEKVRQYIQHLGTFECRIVIICGFLSDENYHQLIRGSDYALNTSCGEGQCLPLIEFMSAGVPALSPCHTAMVDYVNDDNSFVIDHSWSWVPWPNDPLLRFRSMNYPIKWESLCDAYVASYETRKMDETKYQSMRGSARDSLFKIASKRIVEEKLLSFIEAIS